MYSQSQPDIKHHYTSLLRAIPEIAAVTGHTSLGQQLARATLTLAAAVALAVTLADTVVVFPREMAGGGNSEPVTEEAAD